MTRIEKAIKALEPFARHADEIEAAYTKPLPDQLCVPYVNLRECRAARQALSDLSSARLEEGDVEWLRKRRVPEGKRHWSYWVRDAHNARIDRLIAFLGHGEEGL